MFKVAVLLIITVSPAFTKPGTCPKVQVSSSSEAIFCNIECTCDDCCPGEQKCCPLGCRQICMDPKKPVPKPGKCPQTQLKCLSANFALFCENDESCSGKQKCCDWGCQKICMDPQTPRDAEKCGKCPQGPKCLLVNYTSPGLCEKDSSCEGAKKCCEWACTKKCLDPVACD